MRYFVASVGFIRALDDGRFEIHSNLIENV